MIDQNARNILTQRSMTQDLIDEMKSSIGKNIKIPDPTTAIRAVQSEMIDQQKATRDLLAEIKKVEVVLQELISVEKDTNTQLKEDRTVGLQEEITKSVKSQETGVGWLEKLHTAFSDLTTAIKSFKLPQIYPISGTVEVSKVSKLPPLEITKVSELPPVEVTNFPIGMKAEDLQPLLSSLQVALQKTIVDNRTVVPKNVTIDSIKSDVAIKEWGELLDAMEELKKGMNILINKEAAAVSFPSGNLPVEIQNWRVPQPVTNININALRGFVHTTDNTVGTTAATLPNYGQLYNRRSLIIFNNSTHTIFIGGSDVTTTNGLPIPAGSYGPAIDAGHDLVVYGVSAQNGDDIRCVEISNNKEDSKIQ